MFVVKFELKKLIRLICGGSSKNFVMDKF